MYIEYAVDQKWPSTLDSITYAGTRNSTPDWPSWVPDWTYERARDRPLEPYFNANLRRFDASRRRSLGDVTTRRFSYHFNALFVQGRAFDTVKTLGEVFPLFNLTLAQALLEWWQLATDSFRDTYFTGESIRECFSRTIVADYYLKNQPEMCPGFGALYLECYMRLMENRFPTEHPWLKPIITRLCEIYHHRVVQACRGQRFFISKKGCMGLCPPETRPGDEIVILFGGKSPFILRRTSGMILEPRVRETEEIYLNHRLSIQEGAGHALIGDCYVDGIMHGEALDMDGRDRLFVLV
jgi:hypothetical protein